jgi:FkbM family methyltransferase
MNQPKPKSNSIPLSYQPDAWIYNYSVLKWLNEPSLGNQLPAQFQIFRSYAHWYFKLTGQTFLKGGKELFQFLANRIAKNLLANKTHQRDFKISLPEYEMFIDLLDARFFQVVNELTNSQSDLRILSQLISSGDTFIDIGANHGSFAIAASKLIGKNGQVIAVEAQPHLATIVEKSLSTNAFSDFKVFAVAVGNVEGEVEFLIPKGTSGSAGIFAAHSATAQFNSIKVPIKRFDRLVEWQDFSGKTLIKLDIEGSETAFLIGASQMITALKPTLIIEIHPGTLKAANTTGDNLKMLLHNLGYSHFAEMENLKTTFSLEDLNTEVQRNVVVYQG